MSTYAVSDLHGYPVEKFKALLDKAGFTNEDTLFILGDVIDRNGEAVLGVFIERKATELPVKKPEYAALCFCHSPSSFSVSLPIE